jgi:hypothetical protein
VISLSFLVQLDLGTGRLEVVTIVDGPPVTSIALVSAAMSASEEKSNEGMRRPVEKLSGRSVASVWHGQVPAGKVSTARQPATGATRSARTLAEMTDVMISLIAGNLER